MHPRGIVDGLRLDSRIEMSNTVVMPSR
jgi:hypothetical protein